jgi:hypothetical protein
MFADCRKLTGEVIINADSLINVENCFSATALPIIISGNNPKLTQLVATATNNNVTIKQ